MPLEVRLGKKYTKFSDLWCLGVIMLEMCFLQKPILKGTSGSEIKVSVAKFFETNANTTPYSPGLLQLIRDMLSPQNQENHDAWHFLESDIIRYFLKSRGDQTQNSSVHNSSLTQQGKQPGHSNSTADLSGTKTQPKHLNWTEYDTFTFAANKSSPANQVAPVVAVANNEYKLPGIFPLIRSPRIL